MDLNVKMSFLFLLRHILVVLVYLYLPRGYLEIFYVYVA